MYILVDNRTYKVYGKEGDYYIRRYKYNKQSVTSESKRFIEKKPVKVTKSIKKSDQRLRDNIKELEAVVKQLTETNRSLQARPIQIQAHPYQMLDRQSNQLQDMERHHKEAQTKLEERLETLYERLYELETTNGNLLTSDKTTKEEIKRYEQAVERLVTELEGVTNKMTAELEECHTNLVKTKLELDICHGERDELSREARSKPARKPIVRAEVSAQDKEEQRLLLEYSTKMESDNFMLKKENARLKNENEVLTKEVDYAREFLYAEYKDVVEQNQKLRRSLESQYKK